MRLLVAYAAFALLFATRPVQAANNPDGWRFADSQLAKMAGKRGRWVVVTDIDYTVLDPRARTQAALRAFGLGHVPLKKILWDGRTTALALGHSQATAQAFQGFWESYFWKPSNLHKDKALATARMLVKAKAAGAEIIYLTGRNRELGPETAARLKALGFPDPHQVVTKTAGEDTLKFKVDTMRALRAQGARVLWYMTDSPGELRALRQGGVRVPMMFVRGLVAQPGVPKLRMKVPEVRGVRMRGRLK